MSLAMALRVHEFLRQCVCRSVCHAKGCVIRSMKWVLCAQELLACLPHSRDTDTRSNLLREHGHTRRCAHGNVINAHQVYSLPKSTQRADSRAQSKRQTQHGHLVHGATFGDFIIHASRAVGVGEAHRRTVGGFFYVCTEHVAVIESIFGLSLEMV